MIRKLLLGFVAVFFSVSLAHAQATVRPCVETSSAASGITSYNCQPVTNANPLPFKQGGVAPLGYCQLSVTSAVQTSTCSGGIPAGSSWSIICNEGSAARWRDDGTSPTTAIGIPFGSGTGAAPTCFNYFGALSALQWVAQTGTTILNISFYK